MTKRFSKQLLRMLRNEIPIAILIADLLNLENKVSEGYFRFLCPICSGYDTATNQKTNLARCFRCGKNFNPIDMVMQVKRISFVDAVEYLDEIAYRKSQFTKTLTENKLNLFDSI